MTTAFPFIEFRDGRNSYALVCPVCGAEGEIGVKPDKTTLLSCPDNCGAMFLQRHSGRSLFAKPTLEYVFGGDFRNYLL